MCAYSSGSSAMTTFEQHVECGHSEAKRALETPPDNIMRM